MTQVYELNGYPVGHCWYYRLGGDILKPKAIRQYVRTCGGRGYMAQEIEGIDRMSEPKRSAKLRELQQTFQRHLSEDLSRYRQLAHQIRQERRTHAEPIERPIATCIYMGVSLKFSHLFNDFAHLDQVDHLLTRQGDLFG